jgi:hypothetical protein
VAKNFRKGQNFEKIMLNKKYNESSKFEPGNDAAHRYRAFLCASGVEKVIIEESRVSGPATSNLNA